MTERFIFCKAECTAYTTISLITSKYDAQIFPHLRIKEVANRDWIKEEDFDYALKGHIDFTVAIDFRPVLALELDGKFHQSVKSRERDRKKDMICDSLEIPLVRLDSGYMRSDLLQPVLSELVELWLSEPRRRDPLLAHNHVLNATRLQLEETVHLKRGGFGLPEDEPWFLEMTCESPEETYFEAKVHLCFSHKHIEIGRGRAKVPRFSPVCGRFLAERIAAADAGAFIRTIAGTARDNFVEAEIPLAGDCFACMQLRDQSYALGMQSTRLTSAPPRRD